MSATANLQSINILCSCSPGPNSERAHSDTSLVSGEPVLYASLRQAFQGLISERNSRPREVSSPLVKWITTSRQKELLHAVSMARARGKDAPLGNCLLFPLLESTAQRGGPLPTDPGATALPNSRNLPASWRVLSERSQRRRCRFEGWRRKPIYKSSIWKRSYLDALKTNKSASH